MQYRRPDQPTLLDLAGARLTRRQLGLGALAALPLARRASGATATPGGFTEVPPSSADALVVPEGFRCDVVASWGDPLAADAAPFDWRTLDGAGQAARFGFNCDFNAFLPFDRDRPDAGLLCTNHEYTSVGEMFPPDVPPARRHEVELAAHGLTFLHLERGPDGRFRAVRGTPRSWRVTARTPMAFDGPAAGHALLCTGDDPRGERVLGTLGNCAGGVTPWGTVLSCEENVHEYFSNRDAVADARERALLVRYGFFAAAGLYSFAEHSPRFDLAREPHEANRFGWVVEFDPLRPGSLPVKHTALGRFKHESATVGLADDGRVVVYSGDDEAGEYLYKYVSRAAHDSARPGAGQGLLADGVLHVARFAPDGQGEWVPLVPEGPLADWSPARIAVHTRLAADLVGATPMDRPEDVEISPLDRRVHVCLTSHPKRASGDGGPNPRAANTRGQVLELLEHGGDLGARRFSWSLFIVCGDDVDQGRAEAGGRGPAAAAMARPDNLASDRRGNLWISTDGQPAAIGTNDALWVAATSGPMRAVPRRFLTGPVGCELTGPEFTPDGRTLFLSVQHPGEDGGLAEPTSLFPHDALGIPRPSVVAIEREDGAAFG
jgi:hypothetical protein